MDAFRLKKAEALRASKRTPYAPSFDRTHTLIDARELQDGKTCTVAGRVMLWRDMGKVTFATLQDHTGRMQIALKEDVMGASAYADMLSMLDLGDIIGVSGERITTKTGEPTVQAKSWTMLTKALRQPPEKWHGIADQETAWRQRYLDLTSNEETRKRFLFRSTFIKLLREFYWSHNFVEVETPVLVNAASGALAEPFLTRHNAYDMDVYLRIATETFLKECLVGGFDRVFEVGRVFRNEGLDPSHLQDFTMVEHYAAYWDYIANITFTEQMFATIIKSLCGSTKVAITDRDGTSVTVDFKPPWPRKSLREVIKAACGIDIDTATTPGALRDAMKTKSIRLDVPVEDLGRGSLIDQLYKKIARPNLVQPTIITEHPIDLSPLARRNDENPDIVDRFQLVVAGWEVVNAYSELIDPVDQSKRFEQQAKASAKGDHEAHRKDDEYVTALEYGCPPCSGWGLGVDRIVALLTQQKNLRDVVLFPLMKPAHASTPATQNSSKEPAKKTETGGPLLLQHADYGHLLPAAHGLLMKHADKTRAHLLATGAAMEMLARKFGGDPKTWRVAGMLHDLDWDHLERDAEAHCGETLAQMLSEIDSPKELLEDIRSHYAAKYGEEYPLTTMLRKSLYCVDELTGFIIAVTLVRPSKKLADVEVSSVKKKLKDKTFAAQVDRAQIQRCEELLQIGLDELIAITLEAMKPVASEMGL
jgi:lysyl-tRNA synthetase class 2